MQDVIQDKIIAVPASWLMSDAIAVSTKVMLAHCIDPSYSAGDIAKMIGTTYNSVAATRIKLVNRGLLNREYVNPTRCLYYPVG